MPDSSSSNVAGEGYSDFGSSSGVSEEVDLLPSFVGHKHKVLKSVTWIYLIREVSQEFSGDLIFRLQVL